MKIFRRKKNGREVGTFYVRRKGGGRPISLALAGVPCTDAKEANRRARLALKGKWPPAAAAAAKAAARVEHVQEDDDLDAAKAAPGDVAEPTSHGSGSSPSSTSAPPAPNPSPDQSGGADVGDETDFAAAAAAAAADAAGPADSGAPPPEDEAERRRSWAEDFVRRHGGVMAGLPPGLSPGAVCAFAQTFGMAKAAAAVGGRAEPPIYVVVKPDSFASLLPPLADAWDEQLRRWGLAFAGVEPWYVIVGSAIAAASTIAMGMTRTPPQPQPPEAASG